MEVTFIILPAIIIVVVVIALFLLMAARRKHKVNRQNMPAPNQPVKIRCLSCNELNNDDDKFCAKCGSALK
jgi:Zn finger protein HypA/HybF involved in hydrogenase expression